MKKILLLLILSLMCRSAHAKSVILMIGDGMGYNHIYCTAKDHPLFLSTNSSAAVQTFSANDETTDSAASATAYSCGIKTNNYYLGLDKDKKACETIAEKAVQNGKSVYILTTDNNRGATPSAFYVHTSSRYNTEKIDAARQEFAKKAHLEFDIASLDDRIDQLLDELKKEDREYFVMIEGAKIDKASHNNDFKEMEKQMVDFDKAVEKVWKFAQEHAVNLYITADHETGGLRMDNCQYFTNNHTALDVPLWIQGDIWDPETSYDNTEIFHMMNKALFGTPAETTSETNEDTGK